MSKHDFPPTPEKNVYTLAEDSSKAHRGWALLKNGDYIEDAAGQVIWTKDKKEMEDWKAALEDRDAEEAKASATKSLDTSLEEKKTMTSEDIKKLKEEQAQLLDEEEKGVAKISTHEQSITSKESKITAIQNEGKENPADKQAEIDKRKTELAEQFSKQEKESLLEGLTPSRENYTQTYENAVKNKKSWFWEKADHWIGGAWLGARHRNEAVEEKSEETRDTKEEYSEHKQQTLEEGRAIQDNLIKQRIAQFEAEGRSEEFIQAYKDRAEKAHEKYVTQKTGEEYEKTKKELDAAWESKKTIAGNFFNKAGEYIFHKPLLKHTIGNKWFRFGAMTVILGGSGISAAFVANRAIRFVGGSIIGAKVSKYLVNKFLKEQDVIDKNLTKIENNYTAGIIDESTYTSLRDNIDLKVNQLKRTKELLIITGAYSMGLGAVKIDSGLLDNALTNTTQKGLDLAGEKINDLKDWAHDQLPRHPEDYGTEKTELVDQNNSGKNVSEAQRASDNNSSGKEKPENNTQIENSPKTNTTVPPKESIVEAGSGKGVENAFRAQIEHDHALAEKLKDLYHYKGDISSAEGLRKFSGVAAHQMALAEGYVGPDGSERWVHSTASYQIEVEPNGEVVIHEQVQNTDGTWNQTETSNGTFETGVDKDPSGHVYESTHGAHHGPIHQHHAHVEHLKKSINELYETPKEPTTKMGAPIEKLPEYDLPPKPLPTYDLPPEPIKIQPTVPVQQVRPSFTPPGTHGDPMHNTPGRFTERNVQKSSLELGGAAILGGAMVGAKLNSAPAGKDFLTILLEGFFGPETPTAPTLPLNPLENGGTPMPPIGDMGNGPMIV